MMLNIKELTAHVTTADRARFQQDKKPRGTDYISITVGGQAVTVLGTILSRIARIAPSVEAVVVELGPETARYYRYTNGPFSPRVFDREETIEKRGLKLTSGSTTWTLYHQDTK